MKALLFALPHFRVTGDVLFLNPDSDSAGYDVGGPTSLKASP